MPTTYTPAQLLSRHDARSVLKPDGSFDVEKHRAKPPLTFSVRGKDGTIQTITTDAVAGGGASAMALSETVVIPGNPSDYGTAIDYSGRTFIPPQLVWQDGKQGQVKCCFLIAALMSMAVALPDHVRSILRDVKTGNGRYQTRFTRNNNTTWVGTDATVTEWYTPFGSTGVLYPIAVQKAYAYFRNGKNTIDDLNIGWSGNVFMDFGYATVMAVSPADPTCATTLLAWMAKTSENPNGQPVTMLSTPTGGTLFPEYHEMPVASVVPIPNSTDVLIKIYNEWSYDGGRVQDANPSDGYVTFRLSEAAKEIQVFTTATNPTFPIIAATTGDTPAPSPPPIATPAPAPVPEPIDPPVQTKPAPDSNPPKVDSSEPTPAIPSPTPPENPAVKPYTITSFDDSRNGKNGIFHRLSNDFPAGVYEVSLYANTTYNGPLTPRVILHGPERSREVYPQPNRPQCPSPEIRLMAFARTCRAGDDFRIEFATPGTRIVSMTFVPVEGV
jgi:hypothetical protein